MIDTINEDGTGIRGSPIYHCPFDGLRCRLFEALRRRQFGLYFAVECIVDKHDNNFHNCSRYDSKSVKKRDTHHCPIDGDSCKYVRGCQDAWSFANEIPIPDYCSRTTIRRTRKNNFRGDFN